MAQHDQETILVIDDEAAVRESFVDFFSDMGFRVLAAENGRIGIEVFERERPELVLTDLRMPEVDGMEVLSHIGKLSPETPLIVVSGTGNILDSVQALRSGAWDYILKPISDMSIVVHSVNNALERARLRQDNLAQQVLLQEALRQLRADEEAGRKVQMKLLPPTPFTVGPYTLSQCVVPSTGLSGDFVDYFTAGKSKLVFYAADVSGHGTSSALVTVLLRSFMRKQLDKYSHQHDDALIHPSALLTRLNRELLEQDLGKHITVFYAVLDCEANDIEYSCGGQFPAPLLFADSGVEVLGGKGMVVGLFSDAVFESVRRKLPERFLLAVYSDGILEVLPEEDVAKKLRFLETLDTGLQIGLFMTELQSSLELPDDVAVLTVERCMAHGCT